MTADSWDRIRDRLAAEASGRELRPAVSQRTLFGIRSTVEQKMDDFAAEIEREQAERKRLSNPPSEGAETTTDGVAPTE